MKNNTLDTQITSQEIVAALSRLKDGKAPGSDRIPIEFYKYGSDELVGKLSFLFNNILEYGVIPQQFKEALIFPIHKKGSRADPANYRGISFLNASYKVFTAVLQRRLTTWIEVNKLFKEYQAGFRPGYSTIDHIFVLRSIAESFLVKRKKLYAFFVDFKAAFDTVDRKALLLKLFNMGISIKFGRVLQNLYEDTLAAVWNGDTLSEWFHTKTGVRQGCSLSPVLFALFIEDIVDSLPGGIEYAGVSIKALLFADDIVLLAYSPETLQLMINRLAEYCSLWSLVVNLEKSKVMIFKNGGGRNCSNENWTFNGEQVGIVNEYKYLGVYLTKNLSLEKHLKEKLTKAKTAINTTWKKCFANKNIAHSSKYKVLEAVAESILFYAAQVWGSKRYDAVEKLLRYYIKRTFHLPPSTPNYLLSIETGLSPLFIKTLKLQFGYVLKVLNMDNHRLPKKVALRAIGNRSSWYRDWIELAQSCGMELNLDPEAHQNWKPILTELILKLDLQYRDNCCTEAAESTHRRVYSRLSYNLDCNYFRDEYSTEVISMMVKLRGELIQLNFIPHRSELPVLCGICNKAEREDVFHFMGRCPTLRETRRHFFGMDFLSEELVIDFINEMDVPKLYEYCRTALNYRNRIITENF